MTSLLAQVALFVLKSFTQISGVPIRDILSISVLCAESMGIYDDIDADVLRNYQEFALVNIIYLALRESSTSEQSARMTAMDSASKNACKTLYILLY